MNEQQKHKRKEKKKSKRGKRRKEKKYGKKKINKNVTSLGILNQKQKQQKYNK